LKSRKRKTIKGKNVNLRIAKKEDKNFIKRLLANVEVSRFINPYYSYTQDAAIKSIVETGDKDMNFIAEMKNSTPIGLLMNIIEWQRFNAISTIIFGEKNIYSANVGFESIGVLMRFLKEEINLRRIEFEIFSTNKKMKKLFRFMQYEEESLLKRSKMGKPVFDSSPELKRKKYHYIDGKFIDQLNYSFVIDDWDASLENVHKIALGHFRYYEK